MGTHAGVGVEGDAGSDSDVLVEKQEKENHPKGTCVQTALIKGVQAVCLVLTHKRMRY